MANFEMHPRSFYKLEIKYEISTENGLVTYIKVHDSIYPGSTRGKSQPTIRPNFSIALIYSYRVARCFHFTFPQEWVQQAKQK